MSNPWSKVEGVLAKISRKNALYPLLVALLFVCVFAWIVFIYTSDFWLRLFSLVIVAGVIFQIIKSFNFFTHNNPDMLRSETHVIQRQALTILGDEKNVLSVSATDIVSVINQSNPEASTGSLEPVPGSENILDNTGNHE